MTDFFTADQHFNHAKIIEYCGRPFATVEEMNEALIACWNAVVQDGDTVYHLGDFGMGNAASLKAICERLNGNKILIRGNHDNLSRTAYKQRVGFLEVYDQMEYGEWLLSHYPSTEPHMELKVADQWVICGHVHDMWRVCLRNLNVGVDMNDFYPISLEEVKFDIMCNEEAYV